MKSTLRRIGFGAVMISVMLYTGCGSDDTAPQALCRVKTKTYGDGSKETYSYNAVGLVSKIDYDFKDSFGDPVTGTMTMTFDGSGKVTGASLDDNSTYTFGYNSEGAISEVQYEPGDDAPATDYPSVTTYTYNTAGLITKIETELQKEPESESYYYRYVFNSAGNLVQEFYSSNGGDEVTRREFTIYDDKKCAMGSTPFATFYIYDDIGYLIKLRSIFDPSVVSTNNPKKYTFHTTGGSEIDYEITYTYSEYGYPTETIDNFGNEVTYTYECL